VVQVAGGRPGRRLGFAWSERQGATSYTPHESSAFNSAGGAITATKSSEGQYAMHFAGLQKLPGHTEHVQVTSYGLLPGLLTTCNVVRWDNVADGLTVVVECRDGGGQFVDSAYMVLVIE
jgi:hypothetical protein